MRTMQWVRCGKTNGKEGRITCKFLVLASGWFFLSMGMEDLCKPGQLSEFMQVNITSFSGAGQI